MKTTAFEPRIVAKNDPYGQWVSASEDTFDTRDEAIQAGIDYIEVAYDKEYTEWQRGNEKLVIAKVAVTYEEPTISLYRVPNVDECLEPRDYVAVNLREALKNAPNTGDWHGQLMKWCDFHLEGKDIKPNETSKST